MPHGLATGSNHPTSSLPASSLKYPQPSGSRSTGMVGDKRGDVLGDDVEVFGGMQRNDRAGIVAEFACPHPCAVDDCVGADVAGVGCDADRPAALDDDLVDLDVLDDFHTAAARALGQRLGGVDRIRLTVVGQQHAADEVVDVGERDQFVDVRLW